MLKRGHALLQRLICSPSSFLCACPCLSSPLCFPAFLSPQYFAALFGFPCLASALSCTVLFFTLLFLLGSLWVCVYVRLRVSACVYVRLGASACVYFPRLFPRLTGFFSFFIRAIRCVYLLLCAASSVASARIFPPSALSPF